MVRTGVFATEEQVERMKSAAIMMVGGVTPEDPAKVAHACALEQGLPEIEGYYGCDLKAGEFVRA
jgi:hypothetical protein